MSNSFFKSQQSNKVNSPEELNDYIKTSNPGAWLTVTSIIILLCSVLVWATFGSLNTTVTLKGVSEETKTVCFVSDINGIKNGNSVTVNGCDGKVSSVSEKPLSREDVISEFSLDEYTVYCLELNDWNYVVEIETQNGTLEGIVDATIVTESTSPISFVLN